VLIRTADVDGDDLEDDAVIDFFRRVFEPGVVNRPFFPMIWAAKNSLDGTPSRFRFRSSRAGDVFAAIGIDPAVPAGDGIDLGR
jgi:hypothetical protein